MTVPALSALLLQTEWLAVPSRKDASRHKVEYNSKQSVGSMFFPPCPAELTAQAPTILPGGASQKRGGPGRKSCSAHPPTCVQPEGRICRREEGCYGQQGAQRLLNPPWRRAGSLTARPRTVHRSAGIIGRGTDVCCRDPRGCSKRRIGRAGRGG